MFYQILAQVNTSLLNIKGSKTFFFLFSNKKKQPNLFRMVKNRRKYKLDIAKSKQKKKKPVLCMMGSSQIVCLKNLAVEN